MKKEVQLSARLKALAELISPGLMVCDVGCDHGFLDIYLIQKNIAPRVLAMDVRKGPLSKAAEHVKAYELGEYIETRLSDGLQSMQPKEAQVMVCAGMGARLMMQILVQNRKKAQEFQELILQPQSELPLFRKFLRQQGYLTILENMIEEDGKYYPMMKVKPTGSPIVCNEPLYDLFGENLLKQKHPVLKQYLLQQKNLVNLLKIELKRTIPSLEETTLEETALEGTNSRNEKEEREKAKQLEGQERRKQRFYELERELASLDKALAFWEENGL